MDTALAGRVARFAPPWLRYMLTLSEVVRTGDGWVVANDDDIALWDTDAGAVMPLWPTQELAAEVIDGEGEAAPVGTGEIVDRLLPFLETNDAAVCLFPNFDDDILVEPSSISEDLADFVADPVDIAAQLAEAPRVEAYDEWALLESPDVEDERPEGWAPAAPASSTASSDRHHSAVDVAAASGALWLLNDPAEEAIVGVVLDDRPALALFATQAEASEFAARIDAEAVPTPIGIDALLGGWLLVAYGGRWTVALSPDAEMATFVEPTRLALDLAEACATQ